MGKEFTRDDAEIAIRQFQKLLPEDVDIVVIFASPEPPGAFPEVNKPMRFQSIATVDPERAMGLMALVVRRYLLGQTKSVNLGPVQ
jgi:hypothetical protein